MGIKFYIGIVLAALIAAAGWKLHHDIDKAGYVRGIAEQKQADAPKLAQLASAMKANGEWEQVATALKAAKDRCEQGRTVDAEQAKSAVEAATKARESIAARFRDADKALRDKLAGECRDWARQPACGSME